MAVDARFIPEVLSGSGIMIFVERPALAIALWKAWA
jgi:hypothetical protein